jgi:hypothetical protein
MNAQKTAKNFLWDDITKKIEKLYKKYDFQKGING